LDGPLLAAAPGPDPTVWLRRGEGLVGWGRVARLELSGADRVARAAAWWRAIVGRARVDDEIGAAASGLVCFGTFAFDDASPQLSVLEVPAVIVGLGGERAFITEFDGGAAPAGEPWRDHGPVRWSAGTRTAEQWPGIVAAAIEAIRAGRADKVVLARDEWAEADRPIDLRVVAARLAATYPTCWTYAVDGLIGATPELLVRSAHGLVTSRVLAGTIRRTDDDAANLARAAALARSSKDHAEHDFAVASVARALAEFTEELSAPDVPYVLHLPDVMHLATDVAGVLRAGPDRPSALELAGALHPTAAVCGTPTAAAMGLLTEFEGTDRGRYAGPVGWMNAAGDGEWGIALRGAQVSADRREARLFAGGGIVRASIPAEELAETEAKFAAMRGALGG
jgi:menaquinone-specific isochorismate synthase